MKTQSRVGRQVNSIFAPTMKSEPVKKQITIKPTKEKVQPAELSQPAQRKTLKSTVTLYIDQIAWLDRLSADILCASGSVVDRGSLLRGIISAIQDSGLNLKNIGDENAVAAAIKAGLNK